MRSPNSSILLMLLCMAAASAVGSPPAAAESIRVDGVAAAGVDADVDAEGDAALGAWFSAWDVEDCHDRIELRRNATWGRYVVARRALDGGDIFCLMPPEALLSYGNALKIPALARVINAIYGGSEDEGEPWGGASSGGGLGEDAAELARARKRFADEVRGQTYDSAVLLHLHYEHFVRPRSRGVPAASTTGDERRSESAIDAAGGAHAGREGVAVALLPSRHEPIFSLLPASFPTLPFEYKGASALALSLMPQLSDMASLFSSRKVNLARDLVIVMRAFPDIYGPMAGNYSLTQERSRQLLWCICIAQTRVFGGSVWAAVIDAQTGGEAASSSPSVLRGNIFVPGAEFFNHRGYASASSLAVHPVKHEDAGEKVGVAGIALQVPRLSESNATQAIPPRTPLYISYHPSGRLSNCNVCHLTYYGFVVTDDPTSDCLIVDLSLPPLPARRRRRVPSSEHALGHWEEGGRQDISFAASVNVTKEALLRRIVLEKAGFLRISDDARLKLLAAIEAAGSGEGDAGAYERMHDALDGTDNTLLETVKIDVEVINSLPLPQRLLQLARIFTLDLASLEIALSLNWNASIPFSRAGEFAALNYLVDVAKAYGRILSTARARLVREGFGEGAFLPSGDNPASAIDATNLANMYEVLRGNEKTVSWLRRETADALRGLSAIPGGVPTPMKATKRRKAMA